MCSSTELALSEIQLHTNCDDTTEKTARPLKNMGHYHMDNCLGHQAEYLPEV